MIKFFHRIALAVWCCLWWCGAASAHPMPYSIICFDWTNDQVSAELRIPLGELQAAVNFDVTSSPTTLLPSKEQELCAYFQSHTHLFCGEKEWSGTYVSGAVHESEQPMTGKYAELILHYTFMAPESCDARMFRLVYDGIMHQLVTHKTMVVIRHDFLTGKVTDEETLVTTLYVHPANNTIDTVDVEFGNGSKWEGVKAMFGLGMLHISEGADHILFLLALLLPAALMQKGRKYTGRTSLRAAMMALLKTITLFTLGHMFALLLAVVGKVHLPAQPVEVLISLSIVVAAIQAIIPVLGKYHVWITAFFGVVHGLGFATALSDLHLPDGQLGVALLAFNAGIEVYQLYIVVLVFPWLWMMSHSTIYTSLRTALATLAALVAVVWTWSRITGRDSAFDSVFEWSVQHAMYGLCVLVLIALVLRFFPKPSVQSIN